MWDDLQAELRILEALRGILIPEHTYIRGGNCVSHETIMDTAARLRSAWEATRPRGTLVRKLIEKIGHVRASYCVRTKRVHVLHKGREHWLPTDEDLSRDGISAALDNAANVLTTSDPILRARASGVGRG